MNSDFKDGVYQKFCQVCEKTHDWNKDCNGEYIQREDITKIFSEHYRIVEIGKSIDYTQSLDKEMIDMYIEILKHHQTIQKQLEKQIGRLLEVDNVKS